MNPTFKIGKIIGVEIGVHYSWVFIAVLIGLSLAQRFAQMHPSWTNAVVWAVSSTTALLFFVTLLLHELSHAVVARAYSMPVPSITLFALGGVANVEKEAETAKAEFWVGIVGPIVSAVIGAVCLIAARALGWVPPADPLSPVASSLVWLGYINLTLAAFNLIPAFPLDGGRVLKAIIWWITRDPVKSSRAAGRSGQLMALVFVTVGILTVATTGSFGGLWLAIIGWFLFTAATASLVHSDVTTSLKDVRAADAMSINLPKVPGSLHLSTFIDLRLALTPEQFYLVTDPENEQDIIGIVTPHDVASIRRNEWSTTTVKEVMVPLEQTKITQPDTPLSDALQTMNENHINQLPVMANQRVVGVLSRANVVQLVQNRRDLGSRSA